MSPDKRICRRCLLYESGMQQALDDIKIRISKMKPEEKAEDAEYSRRLEICVKCDFLEGGTCLKCGCYPEFRAAFLKNRCPVKKW